MLKTIRGNYAVTSRTPFPRMFTRFLAAYGPGLSCLELGYRNPPALPGCSRYFSPVSIRLLSSIACRQLIPQLLSAYSVRLVDVSSYSPVPVPHDHHGPLESSQ